MRPRAAAQSLNPQPSSLNYLSVCSGIEAASVAWGPLGFTPLAFSEIEPFPSAVLSHHYPTVPNLGDMTAYATWPRLYPDILVGGTPCQSFSVAGLRKGLDDPRGNLMLTYGAIAARYRPRWLVWENVPGVLSSGGGRDFASFLGLITGQRIEPPADGWSNAGFLSGIASAYGVAWRTLDAQFAGVPQRRRRVFVVGCLGDWRRAAAVLLERESLRGDSPPSRTHGQSVAPTISARTKGGGGLGTDFDCDGGVITQTVGAICADSHPGSYSGQDAYTGRLIAATLTGKAYADKEAEESNLIAFPANLSGTQCASTEDLSPSLGADNPTAIAFSSRERGDDGRGYSREPQFFGTTPIGALDTVKPHCVAGPSSAVRRLTPRECERLQGFPDDYTLIPHRNKPACDGPRYKAIGNSMAVPVMRWIGQRIALVQSLNPQPSSLNP